MLYFSPLSAVDLENAALKRGKLQPAEAHVNIMDLS